jgi:aminopeptidase
MIAMKETETLPLVRATYEAAIKAGAQVQVQFLSDYLYHSELRFGSDEQVSRLPEIEAYGMDWADVYLGLRGGHNPHQFVDIDAQRFALHQQAMGRVSALRWQKTRWCLVRVPNAAFAQQAQTDVDTMMDMFFKACLRDWAAEGQGWAALADRFQQGREVRVVGRETDLRFSVLGRPWAVAAGRQNMPDGEVWTAPLEETVEGTIYFDFPAVLGGRLVDDVRLEWRRGKLVSATASSNEDFFHQILNLDAGASRVGEFAIGVNDAVDRFCYDILYDEKIGGTVHIALGRAYREVEGTNQSAIHWDIVKDMRQEGAVYLDGKKVWERGQFLFDNPLT